MVNQTPVWTWGAVVVVNVLSVVSKFMIFLSIRACFLHSQLCGTECCLGRWQSLRQLNFPPLLESVSWLLCSQEPAAGLKPETDKFNPQLSTITYLMPISFYSSIRSCDFCFRLPSGFASSGFCALLSLLCVRRTYIFRHDVLKYIYIYIYRERERERERIDDI